MLKKIVKNVVLPLVGRSGTAVATALGLYGIQAEPAQAIGAGIAAALFVGIDLLSDWLGRRSVAAETYSAAVNEAVRWGDFTTDGRK